MWNHCGTLQRKEEEEEKFKNEQRSGICFGKTEKAHLCVNPGPWDGPFIKWLPELSFFAKVPDVLIHLAAKSVSDQALCRHSAGSGRICLLSDPGQPQKQQMCPGKLGKCTKVHKNQVLELQLSGLNSAASCQMHVLGQPLCGLCSAHLPGTLHRGEGWWHCAKCPASEAAVSP